MKDFFQAVRRDGAAAVGVIDSLGDIDILNEFGQNLLHAAISYKNVAAALRLIQKGINVNQQDRMGETPLHFAATYQNAEIVSAILAREADFTLQDKHGNTALWCAVFNARGKYETVEMFLAAGASKVARQKNHHGRSPLDFAEQIGDKYLLSILTEEG